MLLQNSPDGLFEDGAGLIELEGYGSEGHEQEYGFAPRPRTDEIDAEALAASERVQRNAHGREGIQQDVDQAADADPDEQIVADATEIKADQLFNEWLQKLAAESDITIEPMPAGLPYNVSSTYLE